MRSQPAYFENVRKNATRLWNKLEHDPELAGPWHQLFKQVQSPRHVLSELLQNADDASAKEASVRIENQNFIFEHDGEDFTHDHFASLCRFGYSNKRALHTIGFRGIGFKSTFSLGDSVILFTPSLSICFHRKRFTEPHWLSVGADTQGKTRVIVKFSDTRRQREVERNLDEWLDSPVSLLFFRNIRQIRIGDQVIRWDTLGAGPIPDSEWISLGEEKTESYLLIRSDYKKFPDKALQEIQQERMIGIEEEIDFPPCRVEILLGAAGLLYVVLPTGVKSKLPFACNAPFMQDPARLKVKNPITSPTNRWLLKRIGKLAASAMLHWLGQADLSTAERAKAYGLFPDIDRSDKSLEGICGTSVETAFDDGIKGQPLLLTEEGYLTPKMESVAIPKRLFEVWPVEQASAILDEEGRPALCQHIKSIDLKKLVNWGIVTKIGKQELIETLQHKHLPKPGTWHQLFKLWTYVAPEVTGYHCFGEEDLVRIVPVQGKDVLYASSEVVRLGEKKLLKSEKDWKFLSEHLIVMNQNWTRFLAKQRHTATEQTDGFVDETIRATFAVLKEIGLKETSSANKVINQFAKTFFSQKSISLQECIQAAQIAAKLGATVGNDFLFRTTDKEFHPADGNILFDDDGGLSELLPEQMRNSTVLHPEYTAYFFSCSRENWFQWVSSGRSGLRTFVPFVKSVTYTGWRRGLDEELRKRDFTDDVEPRYKNPWLIIQDWDFNPECWRHWQMLEVENPAIWVSITKRILSERANFKLATSAQVKEQSSNGHERTVISRGIVPSWAIKLRDLHCLLDMHGFQRKPYELLLRTPETESLIDLEPFVERCFDTDATRDLLDLIGVRSSPIGPGRLLDCLRALSKADFPPIEEVEKWYKRLDQMVGTCSTEDLNMIKLAFQSEKLILTQNGYWEVASAVFLACSEDDVPDIEVIRISVNHLTLWQRVGVAERPTADLIIKWLINLPVNRKLEQQDARRVRSLLARYPTRIWNECGCWISLADSWVSIDNLSYSLTKSSLVPWAHLHQELKQNTADLRFLGVEEAEIEPFSQIATLATRIQNRLHHNPQSEDTTFLKDWLSVLGQELSRIELDCDENTQRVRNFAKRLADTRWCETPDLEVIPYIDGTPAGTPLKTDILWIDRTLYVEPQPNAKLAKRVPEEIGKAFGHPEIKSALDYSFERSEEAIREYLEENFTLCSESGLTNELADEVGANPTEGQEWVELNTGGQVDQEFDDLDDPEIEDIVEVDNIVTNGSNTKPERNNVDKPKPPHPPVESKPSIMERFCIFQGFSKATDNRFLHDDGSWIGQVKGARFPWEHCTSSGDTVRFYWPENHCLEHEPLQIEADVWNLIYKNPEVYALVLLDINHRPALVTGLRLRAMHDEGIVILHTATYRLAYDNDR